MGALSDARQAAEADDAPTDADDGDVDGGDALLPPDAVALFDPFAQKYLTDEFTADAETIDQMLTGVIALASLKQSMT